MSVGRKILLVDDDVALRHSLAEQLRLHEEFLPEEAEDGAKALALVGQQYFDAILLVDGAVRKKARLTEKETAILKYLYRAGAKVIGRDTLLGEVWGYNAGVTTHTLETHIYRLRQKIEREPAKAEILVTEPGGYRLVP